MKKALIVFAALLFVSIASLGSMAQVPDSEDAKLQAQVKRNEELKRQLNAEMERQNKLLEQRVKKLKQENAALEAQNSAAPVPNANATASDQTTTTPNIPTATNESATTEMGTGGGGGNGTSLTSSTTTPAGSQGPPSPTNAPCFNVFIATSKPNRLDQAKCFLARAIVNDPENTGVNITSETETFFLMTLLGKLAQSGKINLSADAKSFVLNVEASRTDKQLGADPKSAGTTSLAVKGGIPAVLSWAVENGAAVASQSGNTYTFRVNPVGFIEALSGTGYITGFQRSEDDPLTNGFLRKTSVGFTFDTTRGTSSPTLIGSKQQLSAVSVRYNFINQRDPRASRYQKLWDEFFQTEGLALTEEQAKVLQSLEDSSDPIRPKFKNSALQKWVEETNAQYRSQAEQLKAPATFELNKKVTDSMMAFVEQRINALPLDALSQDPIVAAALRKFVDSYLPYLTAKKKIMDQVAKGTLATFEYTNFREPTAPDLSNFRFIVERGTLGGVDFTANASLSFFNKRPVGANVQRVRDFDFSAQLDKKLGDAMGLGPATLSFAGKYQRLTSNAIAFDGTVLPNTRGDIAAGQIKLVLPLKDSGIKIPFAVTIANRTELVREREVRGNFGFTLDLDTLFARFKSITPR